MRLWFSVNVSDSRGFRRALLIPLFGALLAGSVVAPAGAAPASCENPGTAGEFTQVPAADLGFDAATLQQAVDFGTAKASTSIRILRHGCLAASNADGAADAIPFPLASSSKGVVALAVGRAITLGLLGLDDRVGEHIGGIDQEHADITVRQLLTQSSGLDFSWGADIAGYYTDAVQQTLHLPFVAEPGTKFAYGQTTVTVLTRIVQNAAGRDFQDFVQQELFGPLGIPRDHWVWVRDRSGDTIGAGGLAIRPGDMARLGQLMVQRGAWRDQTLIDSAYLDELSAPSPSNGGYGFLTWVNAGEDFHSVNAPVSKYVSHPVWQNAPRVLYGFVGMLGQLIIVVPSRDLVIVRDGLTSYFDPADPSAGLTGESNPDLQEFLRLVVASIVDVPPPPYVGTPVHGSGGPLIDDPSQLVGFANPELIFDTMVGTGRAGTPGCNIVICNNELLPFSGADLLGDAAAQIGNAAGASIRDAGR